MANTEVTPHGGVLVNRIGEEKKREDYFGKAQALKKIYLTEREISDLELIAIGGFSPLEGFMSKEDYESVINNMRLISGLPWTIPITLAVTKEEAEVLKEGEDVSLLDKSNNILAILHCKGSIINGNWAACHETLPR